MLLQKFKNLLTKADFDYDDPNFDLYKFHPQIRIFLVSNGIFFNNQDSYLRFIWPILCSALGFVGTGLELMYIYHGYETHDYSFATECFTYFIIISSVPVTSFSVLYNRAKIMDLLHNMNANFCYICSLGPKYKDQFLRGQLLIWQLCIMWFVFVLCIFAMYSITTLCLLMYQSLFAIQDEYTVRPFMFPKWLPADDPYSTPIYEIFFFLEFIFCLTVIQTFCVYIYFLFHFLLHYFYLMNMIILDFEVIFDGLDETAAVLPEHDSRRVEVQLTLNRRMRRIVVWHMSVFKSVEAVSSIYGPLLMYQVMISSVAICLPAYQVAESLDKGKFDYLFISVTLATCLQLWIPCYLGTLIRNKGFSVGEAAWGCNWQKTALGRLLRQDIIVVILRAQLPVSIKFTVLPRLELETFSSIISTSYSYFNLLRQYK